MRRKSESVKRERTRIFTSVGLILFGIAYKIVIMVTEWRYNIKYEVDLVVKDINVYLYVVAFVAGIVLLIGDTVIGIIEAVENKKEKSED